MNISKRQYNAENHVGMLGKKHSIEAKKKMSESRKGNIYALGYKHSEKTKKKVSTATSGKNNPNYIDGRTKERLYGVYLGMKKRCKPNNEYGIRGIFVCRLWRKNYTTFRSWALKNGYQKGLSIDRIHNSGPYGPWNCQWLTPSDNSKKRRKYYEI